MQLSEEIEQKLLEYQIPHTVKIVSILEEYNRALDSSDTGTGKTYCAIAAAKHLGLKPFIICPKSVISSWRDVLKHFSCSYYGISNHELIKNCRFYPPTTLLKRKRCPFIKRIKRKPTNKELSKAKKQDTTPKIKYCYVWKFPSDMLLIFDEAHKCKNKKTQNSDLLFTSSNYSVKILLLSATVADKSESFVLAGYCLGLYNTMSDALPWMKTVSEDTDVDNIMLGVHNSIYPDRAARIRIKDLGSLFPVNQVIAQCYDMDSAEEIQRMYNLIDKVIEDLKTKEQNSRGIGRLTYARMKIESYKIPTFIELARKFMAEGNAVAIFVNFTNTLLKVADELKTNCLIYGEQTLEQRDKNIKDFQEDKSRVIICNMRAGGVGVSLHDQIGNFPRISIISPSYSAIDIIQAIGRIHRANTKTPVRQRIIYCKGTVEERICISIKKKIENIAHLNDGELDSYEIEGLIKCSTDNSTDEQLSEFERTYKRIRALTMKKDRLKMDLNKIDDELLSLNFILNNCIDK